MLTARHEGHIRDLIDQLTTYGFVHIKKDLLVKGWHGQDRSSKTVWRDFVEKLPEDWKPEHLMVFEWGDDLLVLEKDQLTEMTDRI